MLAIFRYVVKSRYFSEGEGKKEISASGFAFERSTFLSKIEDRLKRGEIFCVKISQEKGIFEFQRTSE